MNTQNNERLFDTEAERDYWRGRYDKEGYYEAGRTYDDYEGAYRVGYEGRYTGKSFDEVENDLRANWDTAKGKSQLAWDRAKQAARAAWDRVERALPGDADRDGR
jgi:hypothetical protein